MYKIKNVALKEPKIFSSDVQIDDMSLHQFHFSVSNYQKNSVNNHIQNPNQAVKFQFAIL